MNQIDDGAGGGRDDDGHPAASGHAGDGLRPAVSDRWLRIFVAAATTGSFTAAAASLGVGQPAVSHAVKRLEEAIGVRLFDRTGSGIELTGIGADLHRRLLAGHDIIDTAVRDAREQVRADRVVTLSVSTALATYWLMPRLASFKEDHPDTELRVITQDTDAGVGRDEADLWIPLGPGPWPGLRSWPFADERLVAVASPGYLDRLGSASISEAELLHTEERYQARYDWHRWFEDHDLDPDDAGAGQRSNDYSIVVHAALEGQGVALGWLHIVEPLIDQERLRVLPDPMVETDRPFCVVARADALRRPGVEALRRWLLREGAALRQG